MRCWYVFRKSLREQLRDPLVVSLTLVFAPLFVLLYYFLFPAGSTTFGVAVIDLDDGAARNGMEWRAGEEVIQAIQAVTYADGKPLLVVSRHTDRAVAEARLRDRRATVLLIIPPDFSRAVLAASQGMAPTGETAVTFIGDLTNPQYAVASVLTMSAVDSTIQSASGQPRPIQMVEEPLGESAARTEFETYVPGLFVFAVIMLVFQAAMVVAREVEAGGLRRLSLTPMTAFDYLAGTSLSLALVGILSVVLTFLTAYAVGFRSTGPIWAALLVGGVTSFSVIGIGLIIACFSKNVTTAFLIANFPFALLMFFSGSAFPIPRLGIASIGDRVIGLFDFLPTTHAVQALNKVFTLGAGISDISYELVSLVVLSALYFGIGVWLFTKTQLRRG